MRNALFQVHWFVGITAGVILAVVGATGAILSFEPEILNTLNRDVRVAIVGVQPPLAPPGLIIALQQAESGRRVNSLAVWSDPTRAPRVTFAAAGPGGGPGSARPAQAGPPPRGEVRFLDPQTGAVLPSGGNRGETFFRTTRSLHRWLTIDLMGNRDLGRQIVGAATLLLVFLTASGLYLRWPRGRAGNWRAWLTFNTRLKGRAFLWHLHSATGTWVLVLYLVMALTGLSWSYEWYKNGLYRITGAEPQRPRGEGGAASAPEDATASTWDRARLEAAWTGFRGELGTGGYEMAVIDLPPVASPTLTIRYLDSDPPHERAYNSIELDTTSGAVLSHRRYADKPAGERFMASIFPLHSGRFFGMAGVVLFMLASLAMPLFAITGWMLYLARRRLKKKGQVFFPGQPELEMGTFSISLAASQSERSSPK